MALPLDQDDAVVAFVFGKRGSPPDPARATTRLQRPVLAHLAGRGHFRWRAGWCDLA
ncbi:MAG: hypothetical protein ACRDZX_01510 [Acidimicrobiales bacterium]